MASPNIYYPSAIARLYHAGNVGETPQLIPSIPEEYGCFLASDECGGRELLVVPVASFEFSEDGISYHQGNDYVRQGRLAGTYKKGWIITRGFASGKNMISIAELRETIKLINKSPGFLKHAPQWRHDLLKV